MSVAHSLPFATSELPGFVLSAIEICQPISGDAPIVVGFQWCSTTEWSRSGEATSPPAPDNRTVCGLSTLTSD